MNKFYICIKDCNFGNEHISANIIVECDSTSLYVKSMLDNGLLKELNFINYSCLNKVDHVTTDLAETGIMCWPYEGYEVVGE